VPDDLVLRPISGPDDLDLFNQFPYVLNSESAMIWRPETFERQIDMTWH
jgi:hypothetical protein